MSGSLDERTTRASLIDPLLQKAGWKIFDINEYNPSQNNPSAIREFPTATGPADYVLFIDGIAIGVIEAKSIDKGSSLISSETQAERYSSSKLKWIANDKPLRFIYESTGEITRFTDLLDPKPRSREIFAFHKPETLRNWLIEADTLRKRLQNLPPLNTDHLRNCQIIAINNLEKSFSQGNPKALCQMATGSGKTFTAITSIYRLLKFAKAKRILFLVDTKNLGEQAEQEFQVYEPADDRRKFTELYNVQRLSRSFIDKNSQVCISTIQRMYSILKGEELDESAELTSLNEIKMVGDPKEVVYNPDVPPETFDFIVIDECHRSIYNLWKQVLDYFDASLIGLTATPDKRTFGFFNQNVVSEYTHEQAVADGVNVGYDVFIIDTEITKHGGKIEAKQWIDKRERLSRKKKWEQLEDEVEYKGKDLDRAVVNPNQIRTIITEFKNKICTDIYIGREEVPKTLIFAKTDSHAEDIVEIVREVFAEGNAFCKKITYKTDEKPDTLLRAFRNEFYPRIAVTVDMIATGTDVKPLECLIFMRDVRSNNYFQQMIGRGTRTLGYDELRTVTPSAKTAKTHFVVIDAVGVSDSTKIDSRPLERKKSLSLKDLMMNAVLGQYDEDVISSLANRVARIDREIKKDEREKLIELADGKTLGNIANELLEAINPDKIENESAAILSEAKDPVDDTKLIKAAKEKLAKKATTIFNKPEFRNYLEAVRQRNEQIVDTTNPDAVINAGWNEQVKEKATGIIAEFKEYIEANKNEIIALQIFYDQPYRRRELTFKMIKDLAEIINLTKPNIAPLKVWNAYEKIENINAGAPKDELTALVAVIRHALGIDEKLTDFDNSVNKNFQKWVFEKQAGALKFNGEQMEWLRMIKDHITTSIHIDKDDFEYNPFAQLGGLAKAYKVFDNKLDDIINELNEALAA